MTQNEKKENLSITNSKTKSNSTNNGITNSSQNKTNSTNSDENDQFSLKSKQEAKEKKKKKFNFIFINIYVDVIIYILIACVIYSSYFLFKELPNHVEKIRAFRPEYPFPTYYDLLPALYILVYLMISHKIFNYFTVNKLEKYLSKRYNKEEIQIYKHKVSTNIIKFILYLSSTILGYIALKDQEYFPWLLGGGGEYKKVYEAGYPEYLFFKRPFLFDFYYNFNLAFALFDTYILVTYPLQSDFLLMVLHHAVTFDLIVFSYLVNFSSGGSIVYFIHYSGDVISMLVRICIHLNIPEVICCYLTIAFLVVFVYTRLFVFGDVIYQTFRFLLWEDYSIYSLYLCCFLAVLMMLNIIWIVLITKKVVNFLLTGRVEEIYKIKKTQEAKEEQEIKKDL